MPSPPHLQWSTPCSALLLGCVKRILTLPQTVMEAEHPVVRENSSFRGHAIHFHDRFREDTVPIGEARRPPKPEAGTFALQCYGDVWHSVGLGCKKKVRGWHGPERKTSNKKLVGARASLLVTKGIATSSILTTSNKKLQGVRASLLLSFTNRAGSAFMVNTNVGWLHSLYSYTTSSRG